MPQRSLWREMMLISVPLALIGGVFGWGEWQKRFRTPTIALSIQLDTPKAITIGYSGYYGFEQSLFGWTAELKGGPRSGYHFGWNERVVAKTPRGPVVVWQLDALPNSWSLKGEQGSFGSFTSVSGNFFSYQGLNRAVQGRHYKLDQRMLPIDTQSLAWHGEIAAIPADNAEVWQAPLPHDMLERWSRMAGAALWQKTVALPFNQQISGPVIARQKKSNGRTEVEILSRQGNKRAFRRLIAFDGTKRRVLWTDDESSTGYCYSVGNGSASVARDGESFSFEIGRVPASWGEVVFLSDTVYDINKRAQTISSFFLNNKLKERELAAFEKQTGGYRVSRRLVLRQAPRNPVATATKH